MINPNLKKQTGYKAMKNNELTVTPTQEDDGWGIPAEKAQFDSGDDGWGLTEQQSQEEILTSLESPKRKSLMKRFGEKVTSIANGSTTESESIGVVSEEQAPTEVEYKEAYDAAEKAEENLRAAEDELAKREEYFDSRGSARLPRADGSGFTDEIPKSQLSTREIEQAKYFDSQQQHSALDKAQKALEDVQASRDEVVRRSWDAPGSTPQEAPDDGGW